MPPERVHHAAVGHRQKDNRDDEDEHEHRHRVDELLGGRRPGVAAGEVGGVGVHAIPNFSHHQDRAGHGRRQQPQHGDHQYSIFVALSIL